MNYRKNTLLLIIIASLIRCIIAVSIELGNDEVYYRMYAQYLQWNYFDHPPFVGWLIRLTTFNLYFDNEFFIRLGAIISSAGTTWIFFLAGKKLTNPYTGYLAAVIYTATVYGSIITGIFILPDAPQMFFWVLGLYLLIDITLYKKISKGKKTKVLLLGIVLGLGMMCKIHTSFLWFGFLVYIFLYNREWLKQPVLYYSVLITLFIFIPVIYWNIDNHFITYRFHSERVDVTKAGFDLSSFLIFFSGQIFYYNPVIFILIIAATLSALRNELPMAISHKRVLLLCSLPLLAMATGISFFKNVLPHWTGPAYAGFSLLTASYLGKKKIQSALEKKVMPKPLIFANGFLLILMISGISVINYFPGTLGKKDKIVLGEGDFTLDMYGWRALKKEFEEIIVKDIVSGKMRSDAVILCNKWFPASHIDYYVAMPLQKQMIATGDTNDIHQYAWINNNRVKLKSGDDAYCIIPSNYGMNVSAIYASGFVTIEGPQIVDQKRGGISCRSFNIWRLHHFIGQQNPRTQ